MPVDPLDALAGRVAKLSKEPLVQDARMTEELSGESGATSSVGYLFGRIILELSRDNSFLGLENEVEAIFNEVKATL
jgi:hypothetical protein